MTTNLKTARVAALCIAAPLCFAFPVSAAEGEGWDWIVTPYVWAVSIDTDLETRVPPSSISSTITFDDILEKVDGAFQIHIEGQGDRFGAFADFTFLGLSDSNDRQFFRTESDLDTRLFEAAGVWNVSGERFRGMEVFAGLRWFDVDLTMQLRPVNPAFPGVTVDGGDSYSDFMLGARYTWPLSERWGLTLRGDGSFGDTEGTWNASAIAHYRTQSGVWFFGYRYLDSRDRNGKYHCQHHLERAGGRLWLQILICDRFDDSFKPEPRSGSAWLQLRHEHSK